MIIDSESMRQLVEVGKIRGWFSDAVHIPPVIAVVKPPKAKKVPKAKHRPFTVARKEVPSIACPVCGRMLACRKAYSGEAWRKFPIHYRDGTPADFLKSPWCPMSMKEVSRELLPEKEKINYDDK